MTLPSNQHYKGKGQEPSAATMSAFCSGMPLQGFPPVCPLVLNLSVGPKSSSGNLRRTYQSIKTTCQECEVSVVEVN